MKKEVECRGDWRKDEEEGGGRIKRKEEEG